MTPYAAGKSLRDSFPQIEQEVYVNNNTPAFYRDGQASRADLARETGLTRVTISDLIGELIAEGIVIELGQRGDARPGKPAVLLDVNRAATQIIGVDLSEHAETGYDLGSVHQGHAAGPRPIQEAAPRDSEPAIRAR